MRRFIALLALTTWLSVPVASSLSGVHPPDDAEDTACANPFCACPLQDDGSRCDCACCSTAGTDDAGVAALDGACGPVDQVASISPLPRILHPPVLVLPTPDVRSLRRVSRSDRAPDRVLSPPDHVPRHRG